ALIHCRQRQRTNDGAIVATFDDYARARDLLAQVFDSITAEGLTPPVRELVEAVRPGETVSQAELSRRLKLSKSTISWRAKKARRGGWLKNAETRAGHADRLERGEPLPNDTSALPTVAAIRMAFESPKK